MEFEELEKAAFDTSCFSQCSLVTTLVGGERGRVSSEEKEEGEEEDLDKTLTPSQTKVGDDREVKLNCFATKHFQINIGCLPVLALNGDKSLVLERCSLAECSFMSTGGSRRREGRERGSEVTGGAGATEVSGSWSGVQ